MVPRGTSRGTSGPYVENGGVGQAEGGASSGRRRGTRASLRAEAQPGAPRGATHRACSLAAASLGPGGAWPGRGGACGRVPPPPSAPAPARPAGVRRERPADPGPPLGRSDPAMASLLPLLCFCAAAAAHLAGARGEAPPTPRTARGAPERLAAGLERNRRVSLTSPARIPFHSLGGLRGVRGREPWNQVGREGALFCSLPPGNSGGGHPQCGRDLQLPRGSLGTAGRPFQPQV